MTQMNLSIKQKDSQTENRLVVAKRERGLGGKWIRSLELADGNYYIETG